MDLAVRLAARGLGTTAPNPAVGCVLVREGRVVGRGWTQPGGRPHAETVALRQAGTAAAGATAYVTLEPCSHQGATGPCADALIAAGIGRCVVALRDPDPRIDGRGLARLASAGIAVRLGLGADAARRVTQGFLSRVCQGRPVVTLKLATALDGGIATASGESRWITGDAARAHGHWLRAEHDAILIGRATAQADDPLLTCRLPGLQSRSPVRVVLDSSRRLGPDSALARSLDLAPLWQLHAPDAPAQPRLPGVDQVAIARAAHGLEPLAVLAALAARGITRLLIEGGASVAASFLEGGLVDRLHWYRAPLVLGAEALKAVGPLERVALTAMPRFRLVERQALGEDVMESFDALP